MFSLLNLALAMYHLPSETSIAVTSPGSESLYTEFLVMHECALFLMKLLLSTHLRGLYLLIGLIIISVIFGPGRVALTGSISTPVQIIRCVIAELQIVIHYTPKNGGQGFSLRCTNFACKAGEHNFSRY